MRLGRNSLKLDHCGCTVSYDFDADSPPKTEDGYSNFQTLETCAAHTHLSAKEHWDVVVTENRLKNNAVEAVKKTLPEELHDAIAYSFDDNRKLRIEVAEVSDDHRKEIDAKLEAIPGPVSLL